MIYYLTSYELYVNTLDEAQTFLCQSDKLISNIRIADKKIRYKESLNVDDLEFGNYLTIKSPSPSPTNPTSVIFELYECSDKQYGWVMNDVRKRLKLLTTIEVKIIQHAISPVVEDKKYRNAQGQIHRLDGPAVECANGTKIWYQNDKYHRVDGPAVEYSSGDKYWYQNGQFHRLDGPAVENMNCKYWYQYGQFHRLDGPAIENVSGEKYWYINGKKLTEQQFLEQTKLEPKVETVIESENNESTMKVSDGSKEWRNKQGQLHRLDGPAIEYANGDKLWCQNGEYHRLDGPAAEYSSGTKIWYQHGKHHRLDGPAIEFSNGDKCWYQNGKLHRLDGPAFEYASGTKVWYINGKKLTEQQFLEHTKSENNESIMKTLSDGTKEWRNNRGEKHRLDGPAVEYPNGDKYWYHNGLQHRLDGPAIECSNGTKIWYQNDKYHRVDGPALDYAHGKKYWYQNGKLHRLDGPAIECENGKKEWYINNVGLTEQQFLEQTKKVDINESTSTMKTLSDGTKVWCNGTGQYHRLDGPAVEYANGDKYWYQNGLYHRLDGPAIEYANGNKSWYTDGKPVKMINCIECVCSGSDSPAKPEFMMQKYDCVLCGARKCSSHSIIDQNITCSDCGQDQLCNDCNSYSRCCKDYINGEFVDKKK